MYPKSRSIPVEELNNRMRAVDKNKNRASAGIVTQSRDDQGMETVEGLAHIAGLDCQKNAEPAGKCQHGRRRFDSSSRASGSEAHVKVELSGFQRIRSVFPAGFLFP